MSENTPLALEYIRALRDDRTLTSTEKLAAVFMASHAGHDGANAHPGQKLLGDETSTSERTARRSLDSLVKKGWLAQTSSGRGNSRNASVYALAIPQPATHGLMAGEPTGQTERANRPNEASQPAISDSQPATHGLTNQPVEITLESPVSQISDVTDRGALDQHQNLTDPGDHPPASGEAVDWKPGMSAREGGYEYSDSLVEEINDWITAETDSFSGKGFLDARYVKQDTATVLFALMKVHGFTGIDFLAGLFYDTFSLNDGGEGIRRFGRSLHSIARLDQVGPVISREIRDTENALQIMRRGRDELVYAEPFFAQGEIECLADL